MKVDREKCVGYGVCTGIAPAVFLLGADGELVLLEETVADDEVEAVREAAVCCPAEAIALID